MRTLLCLFLLVAVAGLATAKAPLEKPLEPYAANSRATEVEPNDDAGNANPLVIGDDMNAAIDPAGDVDYFAFEATAGMMVTFETHPGDAGDTQMTIYDVDGTTELEFDDDGGDGFYSLIEGFTFPADGTYYVAINHYSSSGTGTYVLSATEFVPPPPPNFCDLVENVMLEHGETYQGDTCGGENLVSDLECGVYTENGLEDYYGVWVPAGGSFTATVTYDTVDGALWVVAECEADPFTCLAYADDTFSGDPEVISFVNDSAADVLVYLVVDAYGTDSCGPYELYFESEGGAVATETRTFSEVKALYR